LRYGGLGILYGTVRSGPNSAGFDGSGVRYLQLHGEAESRLSGEHSSHQVGQVGLIRRLHAAMRVCSTTAKLSAARPVQRIQA